MAHDEPAGLAYADYFAAYAWVLREARARGFDPARTRTACCGAADGFDESRFCGAPGTAVCADRDRYVSWDGVHPTQHAYGAMTDLLYRGGLAYPPAADQVAGGADDAGDESALELIACVRVCFSSVVYPCLVQMLCWCHQSIQYSYRFRDRNRLSFCFVAFQTSKGFG